MTARCPTCGSAVAERDLVIDRDQGIISRGEESAYLTRAELAVFMPLFEHHPHMVRKDAVYDAAYGMRVAEADCPEPKIIDVLIYKIRKKITPLGLVINLTWGRGYSLAFADPAEASRLVKDGLQMRDAGTAHRITPEDDARILALHNRGYRLLSIAQQMRLPYRTVSRAMDRLGLNRLAA